MGRESEPLGIRQKKLCGVRCAPVAASVESKRRERRQRMTVSMRGDGASTDSGTCSTFIHPSGSRVTTSPWLAGTATHSLAELVMGSLATRITRADLFA